MAKALLDDGLWPDSDPWPIGVPLLISLAKMSDTPLDDYLRLAEQDLTEHAPTLSPTLLTDLQERERLVLLIDGFDEVPAAHDDLVKKLARWQGRFALTSRPGHGERRVVSRDMWERTLQELTVDHAREYVQAYFTERQCVGTATRHIVKMFDRAWPTHLGRLLRRPLYLKAWCDYVEDHNGKRTPESLGDLGHLTFLRTLEARQVLVGLSPPDRHAIIRGFVDWFGRLGVHFAKEDFEPLQTEIVEQRGLVGNDADKFVHNGKEFFFESVARRCGLLMYSTQDIYAIPKVPLAEYVIGKYIADDAFRHPYSPLLLIDAFRKWIWRPPLHDILDYTFDLLWNAPSTGQSAWPNELLRWAKEVESNDATRRSRSDELIQDDLVHPFAYAVLRWRVLHADAQHGASLRDLKDIIPAVERSLRKWESARNLTHDLPADESLLIPLIEGLWAQWVREDDANRWKWLKAISIAAGLVSGEATADCVTWLIQQLDRIRADPYGQCVWIAAIKSAARQLSEEAAADIVGRLLRPDQLAQEDFDAQHAWHDTIWSVSARLSEEVADNFVAQLLQQREPARGDAAPLRCME